MRKRNYTQVQGLLPEIKVMLSEGKTQREVAEHFGFQDKYVVKQLLVETKLHTGSGTAAGNQSHAVRGENAAGSGRALWVSG